MRTLAVAGETISGWHNVKVFQYRNGGWVDITETWSWSPDVHPHYEAGQAVGGSYWVPASTNPPGTWSATAIFGTDPRGAAPVNPGNNEMRPQGVFFWIQNESIPDDIHPGLTTNRVNCTPPAAYPPA